MLGRLRRVWLSLMLASSAMGVVFVSPAAAAINSCPTTFWYGPAVSYDGPNAYLLAQVIVNCEAPGRGQKVQFEVWRGGFTGIRVGFDEVDCVQGVCNHHAISAINKKFCDSTASRWYAHRYRTMRDDKFGWDNWMVGQNKTINCLVIPVDNTP